MTETVDHPAHYGGDIAYEHIKVLEAWGLDDSYCLGNATKYIARHRKKGTPLEDLQKARWYLDHEIQRLEAVASKELRSTDVCSGSLFRVHNIVEPSASLSTIPAPLAAPPDEWHATLEQCEKRIAEFCVPWVTKIFEKGRTSYSYSYSYKDNDLVGLALVAHVVIHERGCKVSFFKPKYPDNWQDKPTELQSLRQVVAYVLNIKLPLADLLIRGDQNGRRTELHGRLMAALNVDRSTVKIAIGQFERGAHSMMHALIKKMGSMSASDQHSLSPVEDPPAKSDEWRNNRA